ncbi:MAG: ATP-binding cassette domain-containing protein [Kiloniellaceae bacterium]
MEPNLFKYIWRHSKREQMLILGLVLVSLPFYFLSLNLPKDIVNQGIQGVGFEGPDSTQSFLAFDLPFGETLTGARVPLFEGFELDRTGLLLALSFAFLALVFVNGGFKYAINTSKGRMGERMLRRLRYELTDRLLRFPILQVRKVKQAEMATMVKDEVEPLGGFIGDAFVSPVFLGGQALTAMVFIMVQSVWLGLVAASVVLVQAFVIPRLRVRILELGRRRQLSARQLAGRVGEVIDGAVEVHAHDTSNLERADFSSRLGRIYGIRYEIFRRKFFVKFLNNFLAQLTPFVFYAGGGLLVIYGRLDIGALVAVIAAYKDLPGPVKELIDWDQQRNDVRIKYEQVIVQFQPSEILDPELQDPDNAEGPGLSGEIVASRLTLTDEGDSRLVDSVSFTAGVGEHIAIIGAAGSGKEHLGHMLARLVTPTSGSIRIDGRDLANLPQAVTGRRISYVGQDAYFFPLSVRDNLLYGLKHRPVREPAYEGAVAAERAAALAETLRAGNSTLDPEADWIDYAAAGATGPEDIGRRIIEALVLVDLEDDVYRFGLTGTIDPEALPNVAQGILEARAALPERLAAANAQNLVVRFDPDRYNGNATLGENLLFGTPTKAAFAPDALAENPLIASVLGAAGLIDDVLDMGLRIAGTMVEIFADLPADHPFFEQFSFIDADDLPDFRSLVARVEKTGLEALDEAGRLALRRLPFGYIEARHRLGLIDESIEAKAVAARRRFAERLADADPGAVAFYRPDAYNAAASLQDNILFGRLVYGQAQAEEIVGRAMTEVLDDLGLRKTVVEAGLDYQVGIGGRRLSAAQRQKLGLARALLKQPDLLIVNEALAVMDETTQARLLARVLEHREGRGVIWTLQRPNWAERFDRVLVMHGGRLVEQGSFAELNKPGSALTGIMAAE